MMRFWQATAVFFTAFSLLDAQEASKPITWVQLRIMTSVFNPELGMLDSERDEYATNLSKLASSKVVSAKGSPASLAEARRILALALNLSPRNRHAVVVNYQLSKGLLPEATPQSYSQEVFARLILTRGQLLAKQGGEQNQKLARYFMQLAAELDQKNEDAIYASEVQRLDHGTLDWSALTDPAPKQP